MNMRWMLPVAMALSAVLGACQGCRTAEPTHGVETHGVETPIGQPAVRLYLLTTVAGALEPCGCSKDQLGGLDHLAAFIRSDRSQAEGSLVLGSGPLFFIDTQLKKERATQDRWKAESIAQAMKSMQLAAWAPGFNDWAGGAAMLADLAQKSGAALLAAGLKEGAAGASKVSRKIFQAGSVKVGVVGLSDPKARFGQYPEGVGAPASARETLVGEIAALEKDGAQLIVALAAMPRGKALRLADIEGLHMLVIGQPSSEGHGNTAQPPAELIGKTLVVETANHAQSLSVVDVFVRGDGELRLADGGGVAKAGKVVDLSRRIRELEQRINSWEKGGKVSASDVAARKSDLVKLRAERQELEKEDAPPKGSFFRYRVQEVREALGEDSEVTQGMLSFYKRVNAFNKKAFADLVPAEPAPGAASFIGVEACTLCHAEAREVWDKTPHAGAYQTLVKGFKEYNLECVGCHVTGYGKPGGSTVTHNADLQNVQCEDCHGPGSRHADSPEDKTLIDLEPDPKSCVSRCHHAPHVESFDAKAKMSLVLGPGHGKK